MVHPQKTLYPSHLAQHSKQTTLFMQVFGGMPQLIACLTVSLASYMSLILFVLQFPKISSFLSLLQFIVLLDQTVEYRLYGSVYLISHVTINRLWDHG